MLGDPHGRVGVKERSGGGASHAEEAMCAKTEGEGTGARGRELGGWGRWHGLQSQAEPESEALRPHQECERPLKCISEAQLSGLAF